MKHLSPNTKWLACAGVASLCSCGAVSDAWETGRTAAAAEDQLMLVRKEPVSSFGYERLDNQSGVYPDLAFFLSDRGFPDFVAETTNRDRHYLIMYYLDRKEAYACRTKAAHTREVEFSGPYPITKKEYRMLSDFKRQAAGKES